MQNDRNKSKEGQNSNEDETATGSDPITLNTAPVYADELYESPDEIESHTPEQSQMLNPKRAKSFDVKLMRSAKSRFTSGGEQTGIPVKRQHSEPAANKFDVLRRSLYQRTNSVKS